MKKIKIIGLLLALSLFACTGKSPVDKMLGKKIPLANFFSREGEQFSSNELIGKVSVVMFWAEHCSLSRKMLKDLNNLAANEAYRNRVNFLAVGLDKESDFNKYVGFIQYNKITNLRHAFSGNAGSDEAAIDWGVTGLPQFFIVASDGNLVMHTHYFSDVEDLLAEKLK